jgi:hypothetical protein
MSSFNITCGTDEKSIHFSTENLNERDYLTDLSTDAKIILKLILVKYDVDWIHVAEDVVHFCSFVNAAIMLWVPDKVKNFLTS